MALADTQQMSSRIGLKLTARGGHQIKLQNDQQISNERLKEPLRKIYGISSYKEVNG